MADRLQLVRVEQGEGGYPRLESRVVEGGLWVVKLYAAQRSVPASPLPRALAGADLDTRWSALVDATEAALRGDPYQGTAVAAAALLDLRTRRGRARGNLAVYAFTDAGVAPRYDASVGATFSEAERRALDPSILRLGAVNITPRGTEGAGPGDAFEFADAEGLLLSTEPLHWSPWWPPSSMAGAVAAALASDEQRDLLLALWRRGD